MNPLFFDEIRAFLIELNDLLPVENRRHSLTVNEDNNLEVNIWLTPDQPHTVILESDDYYLSRNELMESIVNYIQSLQE